MEESSLGNDWLFAVGYDTGFEGIRLALDWRRHPLAFANMAIHSTFAAVDLGGISPIARRLGAQLNLHGHIA